MNKRNQSNANKQKLKNSRKKHTNTYQKELLEYVQSQIDIRN